MSKSDLIPAYISPDCRELYVPDYNLVIYNDRNPEPAPDYDPQNSVSVQVHGNAVRHILDLAQSVRRRQSACSNLENELQRQDTTQTRTDLQKARDTLSKSQARFERARNRLIEIINKEMKK